MMYVIIMMNVACEKIGYSLSCKDFDKEQL